MWWSRKRRGESSGGDEAGWDTSIGDECEAYLQGQLGSYLQHHGRRVPPVAWLNQLVHATTPELALLATGATDPTLRASDWRRTVGYLSRSLLERARETGLPIATLQQELLVPLELGLIGDPAAADLDPADLIRMTLSRLYELPELPA